MLLKNVPGKTKYSKQSSGKSAGIRNGFTLIELLVVIAIIGVLSSIVLVTTNDARRKAEIAKAQADVATLYKALMMYNADTNTWPTTCNNLDTVTEWNGAWKSGYINGRISVDPWGTSYSFDGCPNVECAPGASALCSAGPNKAFGSWNRADMTAQGDDICIYFIPEC